MATIKEAVAETLGNLGDRTRAAVVEHFAAAEAGKQANAIIAGLNKLDALVKDRYKIKPTFIGFDADGKPVGEAIFQKQQLDDLKKLNEQIEKLEKAINKADENADFGDLYNLTKGGN